VQPGDGDGGLTPAKVIEGVEIWNPDWNAVLADLDADIAAYQQATGN
jgi:2-aminoethylphosphonate transport system substrate-binding protein